MAVNKIMQPVGLSGLPKGTLRLGAAILLTLPLVAAAVQVSHLNQSNDPAAASQAPVTGLQPKSAAAIGTLPLRFEPNVGQFPASIPFAAHGLGYTVYLTAQGLQLAIPKSHAATMAGMTLVGANPKAPLTGAGLEPSRSNYLIGRDSSAWHRGVPNFARVSAIGVYPGIDLSYYGTQKSLEYTFTLAAGANPGSIRLRISGASSAISLDQHGNLHIPMPGGMLSQRAPVVYQQGLHGRVSVAGGFVLHGQNLVGFSLGAYDPHRPLVIDPTFDYASYFGGPEEDAATSVATDGSGNIFIAGYTINFFGCTALPTPGSDSAPTDRHVIRARPNEDGSDSGSLGIPTTPNAAQPDPGGCYDGFVAKFNPAGGHLSDQLYTTYLGGIGNDFVGTAGSFDTGIGSSFVFGSTNGDSGPNLAGNGLAVDAAGNAFLTGGTSSDNFPTGSIPPFQPTLSGRSDAFVAELNPSGSALLYSSYLGGGADDFGTAISLGSTGVYVTGNTEGAVGTLAHAQPAFTAPIPFPVTNSSQVTGDSAAFLTHLDTTKAGASGLLYSTVFGGDLHSAGQAVAVDKFGHVDVVGTTQSHTFPTTLHALHPSFLGGTSAINPFSEQHPTDAFIVQINPGASANTFAAQELYGSYLGGSGDDVGTGVGVDPGGDVDVSLTTESHDVGASAGAFQPTYNTNDVTEGWVGRLNLVKSVVDYATYFGTPPNGVAASNIGDTITALAVDIAGNIYITGYADGQIQTTSGAVVPYQALPDSEGMFYSNTEFGETGTYTATSGAYLAILVPYLAASASAQLIYATYVTGSFNGFGQDFGYSIAVDTSGNVYNDGGSFGFSAAFPHPNPGAFQTTKSENLTSAFAAPSAEDTYFLKLLPQSEPAPLCTVVIALPVRVHTDSKNPGSYTTTARLGASTVISASYISLQDGISHFATNNLTSKICFRPGLYSATVKVTGIISGTLQGPLFSKFDVVTLTIVLTPPSSPGGSPFYTITVSVAHPSAAGPYYTRVFTTPFGFPSTVIVASV